MEGKEAWSFPGLPTKLRWPWAGTGGNLSHYAANALIDVYSPYVWTKSDQIWKRGLGPRWILPPEDPELHEPGLLNNEATQLTVEPPGLWTLDNRHQDTDHGQPNAYIRT